MVERTWAWLNQSRRLSKDYERLPKSSETMIYLSMTQLMLRRRFMVSDFRDLVCWQLSYELKMTVT